MINSLVNNLVDYPFERLRNLLNPIVPPSGEKQIALSIGEPQHYPPDLIQQKIKKSNMLWGRYPPINGTDDFRSATHDWLNKRYSLEKSFINQKQQILPVNGTREALFLAAILAVKNSQSKNKPAVLFPNPFYHVYSGAATMTGADAITMPATKETNFLPNLDTLNPKTMERAALMYLCSPANPQGTIASASYLKKAIRLANKHDFILALDECYSDIYDLKAPVGGAEVCQNMGNKLKNLIIFQSLSKRSNAPGLRSGFVVGDENLIQKFKRLRSYGGATMPLPIMEASCALWRDEKHVEKNRNLYRQKFDLAEKLLKDKFDFKRPSGGFFLWLNVSNIGSGEEVAKKLWAEAGLKVLPGSYLSRDEPDGSNPGNNYIGVALVNPIEITKEALEKILKVLR